MGKMKDQLIPDEEGLHEYLFEQWEKTERVTIPLERLYMLFELQATSIQLMKRRASDGDIWMQRIEEILSSLEQFEERWKILTEVGAQGFRKKMEQFQQRHGEGDETADTTSKSD